MSLLHHTIMLNEKEAHIKRVSLAHIRCEFISTAILSL